MLEAGEGVECMRGIVWCSLPPPLSVGVSRKALNAILDRFADEKNSEER